MFPSPWFSPGFPRDLWGEFDRLRASVSQLLMDHDVRAASPVTHALNIWSGDNDVVATMLVPGLGPEDIEIAVEGQDLVISARVPNRDEQGRRWLMRERQPLDMSRRVKLPYRPEEGKIEATVRNGILRVVAPRAEADQPRRIKVQGA